MDYQQLSKEDKDAIHDCLFQADIIGLEDDDKVKHYFDTLPEYIKKDGIRWGFSDTVVGDSMYVFFNKIQKRSDLGND